MKKTKAPLPKAAIVCRLKNSPRAALAAALDVYDVSETETALIERLVTDPPGTVWRSGGLGLVHDGRAFINHDGGAVTLCYETAERILPAKVRDEHLAKAVARVTEMNGRKPGKKEYAELKETVESDLLPKAFIKRVRTMVTFQGDHLIVWAGSYKRFDEAVTVISNAMNHATGESLQTMTTAFQKPAVQVLTALARGEDDCDLVAGSNAVLHSVIGDDKRTIRIKDRDIEGGEIQDLMDAGYSVSELGLVLVGDTRDPLAFFTLSEKLVFKKIDIEALHNSDENDGEFDTSMWLLIREFWSVYELVSLVFGGELPADDEDEL